MSFQCVEFVFSEVSLGPFWYPVEIDQFLILPTILNIFPLIYYKTVIHVAIAVSVVYCLNLLFRPIVMLVQ